ncbi:MAG TPA: hypothetical protein VHW60_20625 [Caulobacteraceae bacterium]|jgi:hypothetical protein|nr:hypothetical protein [Caulobacteraceae bacterium]
MRRLLALAIAAAFAPGLALAQTGNQTTVTVTGTVTAACTLAPVGAGAGTFTVGGGNLIDTTTGLLAAGLHTDGPQTITGSWCNTNSVLTLAANPMVQTLFSGAPPSGWTKSVNYTATSTGWGNALPVATTSDISGLNPSTNSATETVTTPTAATISIDLTNFVTPGSNSRLVAGTYTGSVVVTLAPST